MSLNYSQEKAYKTLLSLGSSDGTLRERMVSAIESHFFRLVNESDMGASGLPPSLRAEIVAFFEMDLNTPAIGEAEDVWRSSLDSLDERELEHHTERLVALCVEVMQQQGEDAFLLGAHRDDDT